jgi:hypothetical protein
MRARAASRLPETLAHLELLVREGRAARTENGGTVTYTAA